MKLRWNRDFGQDQDEAGRPGEGMVREPSEGIIGNAPVGAIPLGRLSTARDSLRRWAYTGMEEAVMNIGKSVPNPPGIDVGASSHCIAVLGDGSEQPVQESEGFAANLYSLADWLTECGVEPVDLDSPGLNWIPLSGVQEERGFQVMRLDPRLIKNVPGRKTDVLDCQWLQLLHT